MNKRKQITICTSHSTEKIMWQQYRLRQTKGNRKNSQKKPSKSRHIRVRAGQKKDGTKEIIRNMGQQGRKDGTKKVPICYPMTTKGRGLVCMGKWLSYDDKL